MDVFNLNIIIFLSFIGCIQLIGRTPLPANGKDEKCIPCPQCRQRTDLSKIKRVMDDSDRNNLAVQGGHFTDSSRDTEESQITVKGDYGTKVRRLRLVLSLGTYLISNWRYSDCTYALFFLSVVDNNHFVVLLRHNVRCEDS